MCCVNSSFSSSWVPLYSSFPGVLFRCSRAFLSTVMWTLFLWGKSDFSLGLHHEVIDKWIFFSPLVLKRLRSSMRKGRFTISLFLETIRFPNTMNQKLWEKRLWRRESQIRLLRLIMLDFEHLILWYVQEMYFLLRADLLLFLSHFTLNEHSFSQRRMA